MRLRFNSNAVFNGKLLYRAGEVYEVPEENGFAMRWIRRGAEEVKPEGIIPVESVESVEQTEVTATGITPTKRKKRGTPNVDLG